MAFYLNLDYFNRDASVTPPKPTAILATSRFTLQMIASANVSARMKDVHTV